MADVIEHNGDGKFNPPGTYKDPQSGVTSTITHPAGADALKRMGWILQPDAPAEKTPETASGEPDKRFNSNK